MAVEARPELVGKRFLCVSGEELLELGEIGRWRWRAGVIRAVTHRDNDNTDLTVYVEFDDLEWEKREWIKVYEDFQIFLLEHQLVWATRKDGTQPQGTKAKHIQWPALAFRPLVGKAVLGSIAAVEFFADRQLDFLTDDDAYQLYQDDADSLNPVLRDNPQLHEEVKAWVKDQKVQEIFMQGPYSLNGYRVRVYRQDSATQWFTGIITHHDLFNRTMIVMNDQVLEPQNVDPSMVQMTFLDDVVHSLLKGENIGITSRRRSRSSQNSNTAHGHYTRAQANSPRPVMSSSGPAPKQAAQQPPSSQQQQQPVQAQPQQPAQLQQQSQLPQQSPGQQRGSRSGRRKGSDSSVPDDDKLDGGGRDYCKNKSKPAVNKRRKPEEDDKKGGLKRLKADNVSDFSESSDSENSNKRAVDSSSEHGSESELKSKSTSKAAQEEEKSQGSKGAEELALMDPLSPWEKTRGDEKSSRSDAQPGAEGEWPAQSSLAQAPKLPASLGQSGSASETPGCIVEAKSTVRTLSKEHYGSQVPRTPKCVIDITEEGGAPPGSREGPGAAASPPALQKSEPHVSEPRHPPSKPSGPEGRKPESGQQGARVLGHLEVIRPVTSVSESAAVAEREKVQQYSSIVPCVKNACMAEDVKKAHKPSPSPEVHKPKCNPSPDVAKSKTQSAVETSKPKPNTSPEVARHKARHQDGPAPTAGRPASKVDLDVPRSSFKPVPMRGSQEATKSPLIIDKNEHFTIYRDPALVRPEADLTHLAFVPQHLHPLHASSHGTCLAAGAHHPSHLLSGAPIGAHPAVHHAHLLPSVLSGMSPASLLGGHPRLDSGPTASLGHLALAHHHPHQQQQFLQQQPPPPLLPQGPSGASYNQLGLYPIIWQYPNGTHTYPGLSLPPSKWVHPENAVSSEAGLRRNTSSPWLHQHTPVSSADGLGMLSHVPVRPASADPHRPVKINAHASPPLPKIAGDRHKEELEKKAFVESIRPIATLHLKPDPDRSRTPTSKDGQLQRLFAEPLPGPGKVQRSGPDAADRSSKYKEENRRILQESIEVAPFTAKIRSGEPERDTYPRVPTLPQPPTSKGHTVQPEKEAELAAAELYKFKHGTPQSAPPSTYFTTLSNSVVNEPPRLYPSKEMNPYFEKAAGRDLAGRDLAGRDLAGRDLAGRDLAGRDLAGRDLAGRDLAGRDLAGRDLAGRDLSTSGAFNSKSLSKPPPLIKHQPEGEGLAGKITEQLSQQVALHPLSTPTSERRSPAVPSSNPLRCMPALHRAPVFHPPTQQTVERKEPGYGRLSPPTLTPIQPVSSAGKLSEQQKPPTLLPEMRDVAAACKGASDTVSAEAWKASDPQGHEKPGWHPDKGAVKPVAATASVIVRPASCIKYDGSPLPKAKERPYAGKSQADCVILAECREPGRVILPNTNLEDSQFKKNFLRPPQGGFSGCAATAASPACSARADTAASGTTAASIPGRVALDAPSSIPTATGARTDFTGPKGPEQEGWSGSSAVAPPPSTGSTTQAGAGQAYPGNFVHLKKHKAALAAAQSRSSGATEGEPTSTKPLPCPAPIPQDSIPAGSTPSIASPLTNGQPAQLSQPNYHKLKKAWLTRHSEEDRNTNKVEKTGGATAAEMIKPCTVSLVASTSGDVDVDKEGKGQDERSMQEDRRTRRGSKRAYESASESADDSDESESKSEQRAKRQPKPTYKKKQNDLQKRKGDNEEEEVKPNGVFRSAREKTKLKLASSNGIPRSVLKDWRKVKKLKQTGESFLQDDSCSEIGPNLQKCRECRVVRSKKGEEPSHSPVFCRFYYFRRLSYSKNGVIRIDGFSSPDQYDEEAVSLWAPDMYEDNELDLETSKYILSYIGDKFCQLVMTENTAATWIKKDAKIAWKRAVRGVREMCDACEATLFNIHWVCQKCGFVVCLDCYRARERKSSKDKELYAWLKCVKGQPHDHKHLMPTQIIPGTVLTDLVNAMHTLREKYSIKAHCACVAKQSSLLAKLPSTNGVSQVLQNVLNHSNKISLCKPDIQQQGAPQRVEANGSGGSPGSECGADSKLSPPESQSPLHFLADLAEQKSREEKKENKESPLGKAVKEEKEHCEGLVTNSTEQGSTLRDLLTTTAGKLRLGSTDAGIAFAPVYSTASQTGKSGRSMPNILDDIIASVVENKIPASRSAKAGPKREAGEEARPERRKAVAAADEASRLHADIPHCWLYERRLLWLKDHRNPNNWKLFRECWRQGQPVLVSGVHKKLNSSLWKADSFNQEFADHQGDLLNCKDGVVSNSGIKEFWDGFEDLTKRPKSKDGDAMVYRLKDWPSGEEFMALMPSRYDDLMKNLPLPEYSDPEGNLNLASHLPTFFVRPDLGPRLCCAYGVAASQEQDFGTANLHLEVSDIVSVLVYVGVAKGNGVLSKTGVLKRLEEEDLDDNLKKRLKDSSETPGALWHIYASKDVDRIKEFLYKVAKEQGVEVSAEHDPIREPGWYLTRKLRQRLQEECGVQGWTVVQFLGDSILIPAGALHQVQNLHSCVQVINDFVSPEHVVHSFHLTQELRSSKEEMNYEDKLQVKNIFYHCVKDAVGTLKRCCAEELDETEENS
uniref:Probable JmjC domain-containing histone demethylation protein 2C n=1 Tax=Paramormyrops kingsleyae TaxID=1676925 RepID=A0A3B3R4P4_9TELE|nr:probable JmjC domain-containing histone demethylation protein 2C isoform X2 [Paramormyrops kingsleyae]